MLHRPEHRALRVEHARVAARTLVEARVRQLVSLARRFGQRLLGGKLLARRAALDRLHADQRAVTDRAVDSHLTNLRRKL